MRISTTLFLVCIASVPTAYAQDSSGSSSSGVRREDAFQRKLQRVVQLEMIESALGREPNATSDRDPHLVLAEIKDDFWRVQVVNNEITRSLNYRKVIDLNFIARSASEIKGRAQRLKQNLAFPGPPKGAKRISPADTSLDQLRSSLSNLDKLIAGLVNNPVLREANVVDATLSIKASQDLEEIIAVSGHIKKSAEQMRRVQQKSR